MPQSSSCFFRPRIGSRYYDKWEGYRTMVVGVHLLCEEECAYKPLCTAADTVAQMDDRCPCYTTHRKGRWADYYRLSNCNAIELDTYIYKDGKSPAFSAFTKYLLHEQDGVTAERREWLWEHLCFYNFMQCFRPGSRTPAPADAPHLYDAALPAFKQVLADLRPQYLYVWSRHLADYLRTKHIEGLTYVRQTDMQAMNVHVFSYNCILSHGTSPSRNSLSASPPDSPTTSPSTRPPARPSWAICGSACRQAIWTATATRSPSAVARRRPWPISAACCAARSI